MTTTEISPRQFTVQAPNGIRIRESPSRRGRYLGLLAHGTVVTATTPQQDGWLPIEFQRNVAYVSFRYLLPTTGPDALPRASFAFRAWPTIEYRITQQFGARPEHYARYHLPGHEGVDVAAPLDTPIYAVAPGQVLYVSATRRDGKPSPYGWHVEIDHGGGWQTLYAHLAHVIPVQKGEAVRAGQIVGYSGNTGHSRGAHLHLTLRSPAGLGGWPDRIADPTPFLQPLFDAYLDSPF